MTLHKQIIVSEFVWKQLMTWKLERNMKSVDALLIQLIKEEEAK